MYLEHKSIIDFLPWCTKTKRKIFYLFPFDFFREQSFVAGTSTRSSNKVIFDMYIPTF